MNIGDLEKPQELNPNPAVRIIMVFQDGATLAYRFKEPVSQLNLFAALGASFGRLKIEMPELEI